MVLSSTLVHLLNTKAHRSSFVSNAYILFQFGLEAGLKSEAKNWSTFMGRDKNPHKNKLSGVDANFEWGDVIK
jgi:hypothetical protein